MKRSKDKIHFKTVKLANGHFLHTHIKESDFNEFHAVVGIGSAHSDPQNKISNYGWVHFLEHSCIETSSKFRDRKSYQAFLQNKGAYQNANTQTNYTDYYLSSPSATFMSVLDAFIDHLIHPVFTEENIKRQIDIITNEKKSKKLNWGLNSLSSYITTKWMNIELCSDKQIYGTPESLKLLTPEKLNLLHTSYFLKPIHFYLGGNFSAQKVLALLEQFPNVQKKSKYFLKPYNSKPAWLKKDFHKISDGSTDSILLYVSNINNKWTIEDLWNVSLILDIIGDGETGVLQQWIRYENGWSYGIETALEFNKNYLLWRLQIPLNYENSVSEIRKKMYTIIEQALNNQKLLEAVKQKTILQFCYSFETLSSRIDYAIILQDSLGIIPNEFMYKEWLQNVTATQLTRTYKKMFTRSETGELYVSPKHINTKAN
jgi:predicted Zn-dependent peptidase